MISCLQAICEKCHRISRTLSQIMGSSSESCYLPYYTEGIVVQGFGRGSKELQIPTANFPEEVIDCLPKDFRSGVYYGWASVDGGDVHKMVMNVGFCPQYENRNMSMETHIMHLFPQDFYGSRLKLIVVGYIRPERSFPSIDELVSAIRDDISKAGQLLDMPLNKQYKQDPYFYRHTSNLESKPKL